MIAAEGFDTTIKRLDSPNLSDWEKSQATLMVSMKNAAERERATCALAIFHIKRRNTQAIANLGRKLDQLFPQPSPDLDAQLLRIQLWHDLASEQADQATKHLSQLLEATLRSDVSQVCKLATFDMLGCVTGMLKCDEAQSLIDHDQLSRTKVAFETRTKYKTVNRFQAEIDREIDGIYLPLKHKYEQLMAMRQELLDKKSKLDAKTEELDAKLD